ncbi:putative thioredoxin [Rhizodiscina lignyota]|uniref:Thioredoxin n=1 Tax=Rhizodiscina lignyota TaxID=1504668 RepID=A0A9P4IBM7_9PEZI|nr:putative thioredoxin [Rhizodiscina lignyota]
MTVIQIDVISDIVCAWCYIGKRRLERAISIYQKTYPGGSSDVFSINWRPYYLNYNPSPHSVDKSELMDTRLSGMSPEQRAALIQRMDQIGRSVGIDFKGGGKIGSTRDAHRLIHLCQAKSAEVQNDLVERLFQAYHELEKDISDRDVLHKIATDAGVNTVEVDEWLASDLGADVVDDEAQKNRDTEASGVPTFIIQGVHRLEGAQDPSDLMEIFVKVKEGETHQ